MGRFENDFGAVNGGLNRSDGLINDELNANGGSEVKDCVALRHEHTDGRNIFYGIFNKLEPTLFK